MTATAPPPVHNRISQHLPPPLPATSEERQAAWADAVFAAARYYQRQLAHPDPAVAERAARAIFDLEKTRLRHGRDLAGTPTPPPQPADPLPPLPTPRQQVKACEQTLAAALAAGEFAALDEDFDEDPADDPTADELYEQFQTLFPDEYAKRLAECRENLRDEGREPTDADVRAETRRVLMQRFHAAHGPGL
jgi:hypothetical protein